MATGGTREIVLSKGHVALVDAADFAWLSQWDWRINSGYAYRRELVDGTRRRLWMHRVILDAPEGQPVDHASGDTLDNRRSNLRICTPQQNSWNGKQRSTVQPYKGVSREPSSPHIWRARICVDGRLMRVGTYDDARDAARAYDIAALHHFGEFARLNLPDAVGEPAPVRHVQQLARGERVKGAALDAESVRSILERHKSGTSMYRLAQELGVNFNTVSNVVRGRTWQHVLRAP